MWYVYILECGDGTLYTGITTDLTRRIAAHNTAKGARYTASRLPVNLVWSEEAQTKSVALKREIELKKLSRSEKLALIKH